MKMLLLTLLLFIGMLSAQEKHENAQNSSESILNQLSVWKEVSFEKFVTNVTDKNQSLTNFSLVPLTGSNLQSFIMQAGNNNNAQVNQAGEYNDLYLTQEGNNNFFSLNQIGSNLENRHNQIGNNNVMELQYIGSNRSISIDQLGSDLRFYQIENSPGLQDIRITQKGNGSQLFIK